MSEDNFAMGYALGQDGGNKGGFFGGEGIWAVIILALLFGNGNGGFGFGGGGNMSGGFAYNTLDNGIRGVQQGLCDGFYAQNTTMLQGFNGIQAQMANCCCETQRLIERSTCDIIENQNAGVRSILDYLTREKIDELTAENQTLKFRISQSDQNAYIAANQEAQTAELLRRIAPTPVPSYSVPAPYPFGYGGYGGFAGYGGCGCGCGC